MLREGLNVTLAGRPNVGKSSLFNRLLGLDRAIVTEIAGTTRDTITQSVTIEGVPVSLTDTAGIRSASDRIEEIGVERSHRAIADSDLLVVVLDGSVKLDEEDRDVLESSKQSKRVIAINKSDLGQGNALDGNIDGDAEVVHVSALTGAGLDELRAAILKPFGGVDSDARGLLITDSRHYDLLRRAEDALSQATKSFSEGASEELVLVGLHNALRFLGEITGETTTEEILTEVFSTFCIGK
jgi:tRNA modification GTPase